MIQSYSLRRIYSSIFDYLIQIYVRVTGYEMIIHETIHIPTRGE